MSTSAHVRRLVPNQLIALGLIFVFFLAAKPVSEGLRAQTLAPDVIFVNAKVYRVDPAFSVA